MATITPSPYQFKKNVKVWKAIVDYGNGNQVTLYYSAYSRKEALKKLNRDRVLPSKIVYFKIKK